MDDREREERAIEKLREVLRKDELHVFTKDEVMVLRNVIKVHRGLMALGWVGGFMRNTILIIMTIITGYLALTGAITEWIKKIMVGE